MEEQEQNRSEEATPFKLKRAREKGQVARGMDLGFCGALVGLAGFSLSAGEETMFALARMTRATLKTGIAGVDEAHEAQALIGAIYWSALGPVLAFGFGMILLLVAVEILQLRGVVFSTQPLKPDLSRLNPAKGLKRLFSVRMMKETLKSVLKMAAYGVVAWVVLAGAVETFADALGDARAMAGAIAAAGMKLLFAFIGVALVFAIIDQVIVRGEFAKQMRMSRRELTREVKDREGDPRIRGKRKQLHAEYAKQSGSAGSLPGSDVLVVNPVHYAVALRYEPATMRAPIVAAKGRELLARRLRQEAARLGIPIIHDPQLAHALWTKLVVGGEVNEALYRPVPQLYLRLRSETAP